MCHLLFNLESPNFEWIVNFIKFHIYCIWEAFGLCVVHTHENTHTQTHTSQSDFPSFLSKGNWVLEGLIRTHIHQNATEQLGQFSRARNLPARSYLPRGSLMGISAWTGAQDGGQRGVTSPTEQLGTGGAGSICRKPAEPGKGRKEGERSGDVYVPEAPGSCFDVFLFENECIPCTHLQDAFTRANGEARCSKVYNARRYYAPGCLFSWICGPGRQTGGFKGREAKEIVLVVILWTQHFPSRTRELTAEKPSR